MSEPFERFTEALINDSGHSGQPQSFILKLAPVSHVKYRVFSPLALPKTFHQSLQQASLVETAVDVRPGVILQEMGFPEGKGAEDGGAAEVVRSKAGPAELPVPGRLSRSAYKVRKLGGRVALCFSCLQQQTHEAFFRELQREGGALSLLHLARKQKPHELIKRTTGVFEFLARLCALVSVHRIMLRVFVSVPTMLALLSCQHSLDYFCPMRNRSNSCFGNFLLLLILAS